MIPRQFGIFAGVGLASACIDVAVMQALIWVAVPYTVAATAGFIVGLGINYTGHAHITFKATSSVVGMIKFGAVVFMNYIVTMAFVIGFQHLVGKALLGKVISLPVIAANGFLWSKYWVFK
ncbi:MAG TPA: GtrA family protein [Gammaproteobacteria bacterium]|nr:GtrA family protein [Gammaproteobacteria bacterium]